MPPTTHPTIDCEEAIRRLAEYLDRELGELPEAEVERHLASCRSCWSRAQFERRLRARLGELRAEPLDPAFARRITALARRLADC